MAFRGKFGEIKLMSQTFFVSRFEKSRSERLMNLNCRSDNLFRQSADHHLLRVLSASGLKVVADPSFGGSAVRHTAWISFPSRLLACRFGVREVKQLFDGLHLLIFQVT